MESNGSSSMASVCGGCLAKMDAGRLRTLLHWQQLHGFSLRRLPGQDGCR